MKGVLNKQQIDYVFYHLGFVFEITNDLKNRIRFNSKPENDKNYILFKLSKEKLDVKNVLKINDIPVLFPLGTSDKFYHFENNELIFDHDILKSAFYLLSGYQEWNSKDLDHYDRFPYENSIQKKLGIINKPVVNYYFEIIVNAISEFCNLNKIPFKRKKLSDKFIFLLSHDIDLIDNYNYYEVVSKLKQALGLSKPLYSKLKSIKIFLYYFIRWINPFNKENPYWSFNKLLMIEKGNGINATYFFLEKSHKHQDSYYTFNEPRIRKLIETLENNNAEIGLHGTIKSAESEGALKKTYENLQLVSNHKVEGVRQHTLKYKHPETLKIQEKVGIKYDTTLGFAAHEGFRNSYCLPFKLFDFNNNKIINIWEFPLIVMDGTLFGYRKLKFADATKSIGQLLNEVEKFNGVFTFLWHNSFFEEVIFPGITKFYEDTINQIMSRKPESITGRRLLNRLRRNNGV